LAYWLPKGSVIIDGKWDKDASDFTISVSTLIEADTNSRWRLTRKVNHLFEDTVLIEVDPTTGLLKTTNGTSEDKSAEIVATALQAAAKAMTFGAAGPVAGTKEIAKPTPSPCQTIPLTIPFHFKIPVEHLRRNQYCRFLQITGPTPAATPCPSPSAAACPSPTPPALNLTLQITRTDRATSEIGSTIGKIINGNTVVDGLVVRAPAPYLVTITKEKSPDLPGEQTVFLPDPDRIYYLPLDRTPFVKNETKIGLTNGVVQSVTVTRPSIILGIVGVPKTILEALIPLRSP